LIRKPFFTKKDPNTKPYIDWLRKHGIEDVKDEDFAIGEWELWLTKAMRMSKRTDAKILQKNFSQKEFLKQIDIPEDANESSDIALQTLNLIGRKIVRRSSFVVISEHAVKRWWDHTKTIADVYSWIAAEEDPKKLRDENTGGGVTALYHPDALLLGECRRGENCLNLFDIDTKREGNFDLPCFRIKTAIPVDMLNESQTARWYQLKQTTEKETA